MNQTTIYCEKCGYKLSNDWIYCVKCSKKRFDYEPKECTQCGRIINDPEPVFCPFCQTNLEIQIPLVQKPEITIQKEPERVSIVTLKDSESKLSFKTFLSNYMFDTHATSEIMNNTRLTIIGLLIIIISGIFSSLSSSLSLYLVEDRGFDLNDFRLYSNMISQIILLITIIVSITIILSILRFKINIQHFIRLMGSYALIFVIKDIVLLILSLYISFFNTGAFYMTGLLFGTSLTIVHLFVFIHLSITTKAITQSGLTLSLVLILIAYIMAFAFAGGYAGPFIELISEFLL